MKLNGIQVTVGHRPHLSDILAKKGFEESVGGSVRGWSKLQVPGRCWRNAYYEMVCGLRLKKPSDAIDRGTLYHACMAEHFLSGGERTLKPLEAVQWDVPEMANDVKRAIELRMERYGAEEAQTWDIRAVEEEAVGILEGIPSTGAYAGKKIKAPVSSKFDLVIGKRAPGAVPSPPGPVLDGVHVFDYKTGSRLTRDKISGFGMDGQLMLMALNWKLADLDKVYGPLRGFVLEIVTFQKEIGIERMEIDIQERDVQRFQEYITPWAVELESMLALPPEVKGDERLWPVNFAGCKQPWGLCKFFNLCESHGDYTDPYEQIPGFVPASSVIKQEVPRRRISIKQPITE